MDVAIVILNWNGRSLMERFIPVLLKNTPQPTERLNCFVVVADNASTDGSVEWLEANYPQIDTIVFDKNYGFAGGYNRAFKEIEADYYVLLNSDVEVVPGWVEALSDFMEDNPDVGICQPKVLALNQRDHFEYAGACGGFVDALGFPFCRGRILSNVEQDRGQYDESMECFWATGACMMIRSGLYHHLGGLDESFFAHMEEIDLCWRAKLAGHSVWAVPAASVYHLGGGSLDNASPRKLYLNYRNNLLMLYKNLPYNRRSRLILTRKVVDGLAAVFYFITGKWRYVGAVASAHRDFRRMKGSMEPSAFSEDGNDIGHLRKSIIWLYIKSLGRLTFDKIRF